MGYDLVATQESWLSKIRQPLALFMEQHQMARMGILGTVVFALASVAIPAYLSGSKAEVPLSLVSVLGALICFECARNSQ